jgi:hypothetical protein
MMCGHVPTSRLDCGEGVANSPGADDGASQPDGHGSAFVRTRRKDLEWDPLLLGITLQK